MLRQRLKQFPLVATLNAAIKARQQEKRAARSLAHYQEKAKSLGISPLEGAALKQALQKRLAGRRAGRAPARLGEMHIFLAFGLSNWEAVLPMALSPFGKVSVFEWCGRGFDDKKPDWISKRDEMNRAMMAEFDRASHQTPVDAVVGYLSGDNTSPQTLERMASTGAAIFNFCWDDKLNFPGEMLGGRYTSPAAIASTVDLNLTNAPESVIKYFAHDGLAMFWPEAAHPDVHKPYDVPFEFDVSFVGGRYGWRPAFMRGLQRQGIRVECFGKGWPGGPLSDDQMVRLYSRSRINLGFGGIGYSKKLMCLKGRDFEVPMSGGLYLTQNNPELNLVFDVGREIDVYSDEADCAAKIRRLLGDKVAAARMRSAGRQRALRDHTYQERWIAAFRLAGLLTS